MTEILTYINELRSRSIALVFRGVMAIYGAVLLQPVLAGMKAFYALLVVLLWLMAVYSIDFERWSESWRRWLKLCLDVYFTGFIIYWYGQWDNSSFGLTIIPLFGCAFLGRRNFSEWLFVAVPLVVVVALLPHGRLAYSHLLPFLAFAVLWLFGRMRENYIQHTILLSTLIDNFFASKTYVSKPHKVYDRLLRLLNSKEMDMDIQDIFCFVCGNKRISLFNSSTFIWNYSIDALDTLLLELSSPNPRHVIRVCISLNGVSHLLPGYVVSRGDSRYLFLVHSAVGQAQNPIRRSVRSAILRRATLMNVFSKLAKVFEAERIQKTLMSRKMYELTHKVNYVNSAINTMHFIRNELTPLKNYIAMKGDLEQEPDEERRKKIQAYIDKQYVQLKDSFQQILVRADILIEKGDNPFVYTSTDMISVEELMTEIRRLWLLYQLDEGCISAIRRDDAASGQKRKIACNREALTIVVDNWVSNISKYGLEGYSIKITDEADVFTVEFKNVYDRQSQNIDFVRYFSDNNRTEINKSRWVGLGIIMDYLEQMDIPGQISNDEDSIFFRLTFVKTETK